MNKYIVLASQWRRIFARLFDLIIIISIYTSIFYLVSKQFEFKKDEVQIVSLISFSITIIFFVLLQIVIPFLNKGKTIGKYIFKIKIINENNKKLPIIFFVIREFFIYLTLFLSYILSNFLYLILLKNNLLDNKEIIKLIINSISCLNIFWFIFIFIFQKINKSNRLFYDSKYLALVVMEGQQLFVKEEKKIETNKKMIIKTNINTNNNINNNFLNKNQLKATLISKEKNLRIIAGPGTGKTTVLVSRILHLIKNEKVDFNKILILTFTKKACKNIKERIQNEISDFNGKNIFTYHSFCYKFLLEEKNHLNFVKNKNLNILDQEDQKQIIKNIIKENKIDLFGKIIDKETINYIFESLNETKFLEIRNYQNFKEIILKFDSILNENQILFLWNLSNEYEKYKQKNNLLDFFDLLKKTYFLLKENPSLLIKWKRRYSQIIIDEFQDTNKIQYLLIKLLSNNGKDIKVSIVGDPDQTIYGWRDADIEYILNFDKDFKDTETIILNKNYRSSKDIVDLSNSFILKNKNRILKNIIATKKYITKPELFIGNEYEQVEEIVNKIKVLIDNFVPLNEICIIYRSHYLSAKLEKELINNKINYYIFKGIKFFLRREIKDFLILISLLVNENDFEVEQILMWVKAVGVKTIIKLKNAAKEENKTLLEFIENISDNIKFNNISSNINEVFDNIFIYKKQLFEIKSLSYLSKVIFEKIYLNILNKLYFNKDERIKNIKILLNIINDFENKNLNKSIKTKISKFLNMIKISISDDFIDKKNSINLMTVHNTKGLEFDHVFIFNVSKNIFPTKRIKTINELEEERRLLFVGMTRARKTLFITSDYNFSDFIEELQKTKQINIIN